MDFILICKNTRKSLQIADLHDKIMSGKKITCEVDSKVGANCI